MPMLVTRMGARVFLINLSKDTDRLKAMSNQLVRLALPFERIEAVYGTQLPEWLRPYFLNAQGQVAPELEPGEVGCYASHLLVLKRIVENNTPGLVLEDDLELDEKLPEILASTHALPRDWDILRLSGYENHFPKFPAGALSEGKKVIKYSRVPFGTGAYLITPQGARKFLSWRTLRTAPVDYDLRRVWDCRLATYGIDPFPVRQNTFPSVIEEMGTRKRGKKYHSGQRLSYRVGRLAYEIRWLGIRNWGRSLLSTQAERTKQKLQRGFGKIDVKAKSPGADARVE